MYSIIIITYNEEKKILSVIKSVKQAAKKDNYEIIISDGGSSDKTVEIAKSENVKVINSKPGRGVQFVSGVNASKGDLLIFLHGDTIFPSDGFQVIEEEFSKGIRAATFRMKFDENRLLYNLYGWFTRFDSLFSSFGDQGFVVNRELYTQVGGFPEWQIFEDVELFRKIRKKTRIKSLPAYVVTSARRFEKNGIIKQQILNFFMILGFYFGIDHLRLKEIYAGKKSIKNAVVLFTRFPESGKVKTRLAKSIGEKNALDFYKVCCEHCFEETKKLGKTTKFAFITENKDISKSKDWLGDDFRIEVQQGTDLGVKMQNAADKILRKFDRIVILGTDIPDISSDIIQQAFEKLNEYDIVIGPSCDGGYYLIGMNKLHKMIFDDIEWSTERVLEQTITKIEKAGLTYALLPVLRDVDYFDDLKIWAEQNRNKYHPVKIWLENLEFTNENN